MSQRDVLQRPYGNHQRMESHQAVQTLGGEGGQVKGKTSHYPSYRRTAKPYKAYSDSFRLTRSRPTQLSCGSIPFMHQQISGQQSPFFKIIGSFQENTRIQGQKQDIFLPKAERVIPNDTEAGLIGERSTQEPETVVNTSRVGSPNNGNITPLIMNTVFLHLKEGHSQWRNAFEETNNRLTQVFEEQHHCRRDRDCLDQGINNLFNVYQNMKPQPQGHYPDDPYHQEDIKPDSFLVNKAISPSKYQDKDNMSYSEKEASKQLPEVSSWPKIPFTGDYDQMELIAYIDGIFIDVPSIPDYWITAKLNTEFEGHASIWYTEMKEMHGKRSWPWWKSQIIQKYSNDDIANTLQDVRKTTNIGNVPNLKELVSKRNNFSGWSSKTNPKEKAEVTKKKNTCCTFTSTNPSSNNCPKAKKKVYAIEKVPEAESPTEDLESHSMGDSIRKKSDDDQDPREEFLMEYQEKSF
ncbi:hypothetical protein O181_001796 [Austropuccinia psidii MF-1]|uniref:Uncharacterized protein n=1 Tax=Austropuccinia psidii MF-1 TaxID=1389203 RepID=A0A9Q3BBS4_9BASI|nr:hypothetical protein [Austropuccinia psidii MF-1]